MTIDGTIEKLTSFAVKQGVATVCLFLMIIGGIWLAPKHISQIQQGYKDQAAEFERMLAAQQASFERNLQIIVASNERERDIFLSIVRQKIDAIEAHKKKAEAGT